MDTPGVKAWNEKKEMGDEDDPDDRQWTQYKQITARANFLARDRSDQKYAAKELTHNLAKHPG